MTQHTPLRQSTTGAAPGSARRFATGAAVNAWLFLNPDTIAAACGLTAADLALLAGLPPQSGDDEPWHPQLQALLRELVDLFARAKAASPHQPGAVFWAAHRAVRALGDRTLVEAIADGDRAAVDAHLRQATADSNGHA